MVITPGGSIVDQLEAHTPTEVWKRTLEILESINDGPEDEVVVGTARKAICLLDAFSKHGLIRRDKRLLSSRIVDIDPAEIANQDILVVEDLVTSTRTLRYTMRRLKSCGARSIRAIGFARNTDYEFDGSLELRDPDRMLTLTGTQSAALGQSLLDMLTFLSRSYNVDWPILYSLGRPDGFVEAARSVAGWYYINSTSKLQQRVGIHSLTFYPSTLSISEPYKDSIAIPKIRAIFRPGQSLQLIPILAFSKWSDAHTEEVRGLFPDLPLGRYAPQAFAQHMMSVELGRSFVAQVQTWRPQHIRFRESAHTLQVAYGHALAHILSRPMPEPPNDTLGRWLTTSHDQPASALKHFSKPSNPILASECQFILSGAFYDYYVSSGEKTLRDVARMGDVAANKALMDTADLLEIGLSIDDLEGELTNLGYSTYDARAGVSTFLDRAIDTGLVVPILTPEGRRFRPGEVAMFSETAKRLCEVLLRQLSYLKSGAMSQFLTQKALVTLWKYGTQLGTALLDQAGEGTLVSVQYYTHGAVLDKGKTTKVSRAGNFTVTNTLESVGVLESIKGGYSVNPANVYEETDPDNERKVKALARMIHRLTERTTTEWTDEEEYIYWVSTADLGQAPTALAADISLCEEEFISTAQVIVRRLLHGDRPRSLVERMRRSHWHDALTAGWRKVLWIEENNNERYENAQRERVAVTDEFALTFLDDLVRSVRGGSPPLIAHRLRRQAEGWLLASRILWSLLVHVAVEGEDAGALQRRMARATACAANIDPESRALLDKALRIATQYVQSDILLGEECLALLLDLRSTATQVVSTIEAATDTDGRVHQFHEFTAAALVFASEKLDQSVFNQDLRMTRRHGHPSDTIIDFSSEYRQAGVFAIAGRGQSAGSTVADVALTMLRGFEGRYRRIVVFRQLLSSQRISQSTRTSAIACAAFRNASDRYLQTEIAQIEEVGSPFELPETISTSSKSASRASFHVTVSEPVLDGQVRHGYAETAMIRPNTARKVASAAERPETLDTTTDILVISPMPVERTALLKVFALSSADVAHVPNRYQLPLFRTSLPSRSGRAHTAILALASEKGPEGARDLVGRSLDVVAPRLIVVHGIAGAIQPDLLPGDVIIGTQVLPYDYRKERNDGTEVVATNSLSLSPLGMNLFTSLEMQPVEIKRGDGRPGIIRPGTMGSGDTVVRSTTGEVRRYLSTHPSRPEATEMESGAVLRELRSRHSSLLMNTVVVRGISDRSDPNKNDKYHRLAAENAAIVLRAMLDYLTL